MRHASLDAASAAKTGSVSILSGLDRRARAGADHPSRGRSRDSEGSRLVTVATALRELVWNSDKDRLANAFQQLPSREQDAFEMRVVGGLGYGRIAEQLDTATPEAAQAVYGAALLRLAKALDTP